MDKDKVKGTMDDAIGRAKRQIGEWTDDPKKEVEGTVQQVKGKAEKISGDIKDSVRDATDSSRPSRTDKDETIEHDRISTGNRR